MSSFFKKAMKIVHPATRLFEDRGNPQGYTDIGERQAHQGDLDQAMKDYGNIETSVRDRYTAAAKKAGTYGDTPEFKQGLNSEIQAGVRGARGEAVARINALRKAMGNSEEFKPDGAEMTQGNVTADKLANNPEKEETPTSAVSEDPATATAPTAVSGVQGATLTSTQLARLRALQQAQTGA